MGKTLKVYGWTGSRNEARTDGNFHGQTREIVAAYSAAEVKRLTGMTRTEWEHVGCETGNQNEIETATAKPGIVFWARLNARGNAPDWTEANG